LTNKIKTEFYVGVIVTENNNGIVVYSNIKYVQHILSDFIQFFNTSSKIISAKNSLNESKTKDIFLGANDYSIKLSQDKIEFDLLFDKEGLLFEENYPLKLTIETFNDFLNKVESFLIKYENCKLPGLIPPEKYSDFSVVPNEYINPAFFKKEIDSFDSILNSISHQQQRDSIYKLFKTSPLLKNELEELISQRHLNDNIELEILNNCLEEITLTGKYSGGLKSRFNSKLINNRLKEYGLPDSIIYFTYESLGYKDFQLHEIETLFKTWKDKIEDVELIKLELNKIEINEHQNQFIQLFKRYPNLLIRLEELNIKYDENIVKKIIREQLSNKVESKNSSEKLIIRMDVVNHFIHKHELKEHHVKEARQYVYENEWTVDSIEQFVIKLKDE